MKNPIVYHIKKIIHEPGYLAILLLSVTLFSCDQLNIKLQKNNQKLERNYVSARDMVSKIYIDNSILAYYSFDNDMGNWYEKSICCPWSASLNRSVKRAGTSSLRVELKKNDSLYGHRVELGQAPNKDKEGWFGFSVYLPSSHIKDSIEESIVQWQAQPDFSIGETWRSPPLLLGILNDRFILEIRTDRNKVTKQGLYNFTRIDLGPVNKEAWLDWVFHIKWAYDSTGVLEVWKNNTLLLSRINVPNSYNDVMFPYFKIGIYKWGWIETNNNTIDDRVIFVDEVTIGNRESGYDKVYHK